MVAGRGAKCCAPADSGGLGLFLLQEARRFVGAGAPAGGDGNAENAQVNAELAAMLIPVAEHDVAEKESARLDEDLGLDTLYFQSSTHNNLWDPAAGEDFSFSFT